MKTTTLAVAFALASTNTFAANDIPAGAFQPIVDAVNRAYPDWYTAKSIALPSISGTGPDDVSFYTPRGHIGCHIAGPPPRLVRCRSLKD
jgi:hypothetical protein